MRTGILTLIALAGITGIAYSTLIERKLLITKKVNIKKKNTTLTEKIKVAHFTDVHLGKFYKINDLKKLVKKINSLNADIVIFTGDLVDSMERYQLDGIADKILSNIKAKIGKFAVYGNHDSYPGNRYTYAKILDNAGFTLLKNENTQININNKTLNIMGLDDFFQGKYDISKTTSDINENDFNLLMLHEPDLATKFLDLPIDLALAGHSHGGQIYIPLYGTIVNTGLAESYDRGLYKLRKDGTFPLYVNSGIGCTSLPIRFCCVPNISIITIEF
ncbi:MAG: metallophosphoesterase [Sarcina sp.]